MSSTQETGLQPKDWETTIRDAFKEALRSNDPVVRSLAREVLALPTLNVFCFEIAPKIAKKLVESSDPLIQKLAIKLWSCTHPGHVSVMAVDPENQKMYLVDAAGLLNKNAPDDSPLGITELDVNTEYPLYGNPNIKQYISPTLHDQIPFLDKPKSEDEMKSKVLRHLQDILNI